MKPVVNQDDAKKLDLQKKTVAVLSSDDQKSVDGGQARRSPLHGALYRLHLLPFPPLSILRKASPMQLHYKK